MSVRAGDVPITSKMVDEVGREWAGERDVAVECAAFVAEVEIEYVRNVGEGDRLAGDFDVEGGVFLLEFGDGNCRFSGDAPPVFGGGVRIGEGCVGSAQVELGRGVAQGNAEERAPVEGEGAGEVVVCSMGGPTSFVFS